MNIETRRSSLGLIILGLLIEEPMHAYRMQMRIRERGKDKVVNVRQRASLHQALARLERLGLVTIKEAVRTEGRPDRTMYAITEEGRDTAKAWLREMLTAVGAEFPEFPAAVSVLSMLTPADARKQLDLRAAAVRGELIKLARERAEVPDLPRLFLLEDEYRAALWQAELAWLDAVIADLSSGALGWDRKWLRETAARLTPKNME